MLEKPADNTHGRFPTRVQSKRPRRWRPDWVSFCCRWRCLSVSCELLGKHQLASTKNIPSRSIAQMAADDVHVPHRKWTLIMEVANQSGRGRHVIATDPTDRNVHLQNV
eukprot:364268-Chlamydomonas_euryale.AAC.16